MIGTVVSFSRMRGFGFLKQIPDDGSADIFVYRAELLNARYLKPGETVEFQIGERNGRRVAIRVWAERGSKD